MEGAGVGWQRADAAPEPGRGKSPALNLERKSRTMGSTDADVAKAETRQVSDHEMRLRAQDGAAWWLDCSRHERDEASGVWMARYVRHMEWQPIETAPKDGTSVLLTCGRHTWIGSQRTGHHAGPTRNGQPTTGHLFPRPHDTSPRFWAHIQTPPSTL